MAILDQCLHAVIRSAKIINKHSIKTCSPDISVDKDNRDAGFFQLEQTVLCNRIQLGDRRNDHALQALADRCIQKLMFFAQGLIRSEIYDVVVIAVRNFTDSADGLKKELIFNIRNDHANTRIVINT